MRAEIVAVGSELLLGEAVDTNSAWIAGRLAEVGIDVHRHTTVGDNLDRLAAVLREAAARADALIVTGGLGPTHDDLTRDAVARVAGVPLRRDPELVRYVRGYFERLGRAMPERNLVQADLPVGARVLEPVGTAPGFAIDVEAGQRRVTLYCLPGVPREMEIMVAREVIPDLVARAGLAVTVSRVVRTSGISESAVADAAADLVARLDAQAAGPGASGAGAGAAGAGGAGGTGPGAGPGGMGAAGQVAGASLAGAPTIALLASRGETRVRVTAKAASREEAMAQLAPVVDELVERLGVAVAGIDDEGNEHAVGRLLRAHGWTLAVAESISGGRLGGRIVRVPGASEWFLGGIVAYSNSAKQRLAGVPAELLERCSPVSEEVAGALALGARDRLRSDVGAAVVGVAGPTTQGGSPVGTVCLATVLPSGPVRARTMRLPVSEREALQDWSAGVALDHLRRQLARSG